MTRALWKPIDDAPRDGTPIMVAIAGRKYWPTKVEWRNEHWCVSDVSINFALLFAPTHFIGLDEMMNVLGEPGVHA